MSHWYFEDKSVEEFYRISFETLSQQVCPLKNHKQMFSAIQAVRYVLKELMVMNGEEHVMHILNHGTRILPNKPSEDEIIHPIHLEYEEIDNALEYREEAS